MFAFIADPGNLEAAGPGLLAGIGRRQRQAETAFFQVYLVGGEIDRGNFAAEKSGCPAFFACEDAVQAIPARIKGKSPVPDAQILSLQQQVEPGLLALPGAFRCEQHRSGGEVGPQAGLAGEAVCRNAEVPGEVDGRLEGGEQPQTAEGEPPGLAPALEMQVDRRLPRSAAELAAFRLQKEAGKDGRKVGICNLQRAGLKMHAASQGEAAGQPRPGRCRQQVPDC